MGDGGEQWDGVQRGGVKKEDGGGGGRGRFCGESQAGGRGGGHRVVSPFLGRRGKTCCPAAGSVTWPLFAE